MATNFLAQKLGLVEAPGLLLTDKEWKEVKKKSNERQDSSQPCVICKEDFGLQQQVMCVIFLGEPCYNVLHRLSQTYMLTISFIHLFNTYCKL